MIKKIGVFTLILLLITNFTLSVYAEGNLNIGGSGSALGNATRPGDGFSWGREAVRVSIYDKEGMLAFPTHDWSNHNFTGVDMFWYGNKTKLDYRDNPKLNLILNNYNVGCSDDIPIPRIVGPVGSNTIGSVKTFFKRTEIQKRFADEMGMTPEQFKSGEYTFLIEPVMIFKLNYDTYAMTATEAALYSQQFPADRLSGFMGYLTHQALPLSMYLDHDDPLLNLKAYAPGSITGLFPDQFSIDYMGMGLIYPNEAPVVPDTIDYIYRVDTDVITAVNVKATTDFRTNKFDVTFSNLPIPEEKRTSQEYVAESGTHQIAWIKWHTPKEPGTYTINISTSSGSAKPEKSSLTIVIEDLSENIPPNPLATDRHPGFTSVSVASAYADFEEVTSLEWSVQTYTKNPDYDGDDPDNNEPKWLWSDNEYSLSMGNSTGVIRPAKSAPKTTGGSNSMRSGYGIEANVTSSLSSDPGKNSTTAIQTVIVTFPEFHFQDYNRILENESGTWSFRKNPAALLEEYNRVHFTPVWYPDEEEYICGMTIRDVWTPVGELMVLVETAPISIEGSVFDDWYVRPAK